MFHNYTYAGPEMMGPFVSGFFGGILGLFVVVGVFVAFLLVTAVYVYHALAWRAIARALKHPRPWLAWIPFANLSLILQLGRFHWAWVFLILIPFLGWIALAVLLIIASWRVFEKRNYPGWFSLAPVLPWFGGILYLVALGFVAWKPKK